MTEFIESVTGKRGLDLKCGEHTYSMRFASRVRDIPARIARSLRLCDGCRA